MLLRWETTPTLQRIWEARKSIRCRPGQCESPAPSSTAPARPTTSFFWCAAIVPLLPLPPHRFIAPLCLFHPDQLLFFCPVMSGALCTYPTPKGRGNVSLLPCPACCSSPFHQMLPYCHSSAALASAVLQASLLPLRSRSLRPVSLLLPPRSSFTREAHVSGAGADAHYMEARLAGSRKHRHMPSPSSTCCVST